MKGLYLIQYSVKGIKTLNELVSLSFYKKTFTKGMDIRGYNVKGIYGMNGSGKSAIITSVGILKNILMNSEYLSNAIVQKNLDAIINKEIGELFIEVDFLVQSVLQMFRYTIKLEKEKSGKYVIAYEKLATKKATSKNDSMLTLLEVNKGELVCDNKERQDDFLSLFEKKTTNLLETSSMCAIFIDKRIYEIRDEFSELSRDVRFNSMMLLGIFGMSLHVYLDNSDDHKDFLLENFLLPFKYYESKKNIDFGQLKFILNDFVDIDSEYIDILSVSENYILKDEYKQFERRVNKLCEFLQIFKSDLRKIEIDKKEDKEYYICSLLMVYDSYKIHGEFESTGIKKLINLFVYLKEMVCGGIVFIDEFDSNLHDVYLCALLEYLMEHGEGQLCFTTHNVGPMDILKRNKKSIDFLSEDHKIYPWKNSGNYSPSRLYRNGMIEGSPFNIDSIDFIGIFEEEDE